MFLFSTVSPTSLIHVRLMVSMLDGILLLEM
jgi:hypothetical protein